MWKVWGRLCKIEESKQGSKRKGSALCNGEMRQNEALHIALITQAIHLAHNPMYKVLGIAPMCNTSIYFQSNTKEENLKYIILWIYQKKLFKFW